MQKELEIAQVNEMKFYLNWDYVKEICNEAIREENKKLEKQLKIAVDCLKKYANEDLWSDYEDEGVVYFDCIFKSLGYDFAQKALKKIDRS